MEQEVAPANATYLRMLPAEDAQVAVREMTKETELSKVIADPELIATSHCTPINYVI